MIVYTTSMGIVRKTFTDCANVKQILETLLVKYEERDIFMSGYYQSELRDRLQCNEIKVPQVFVDGQCIGVSLHCQVLAILSVFGFHRQTENSFCKTAEKEAFYTKGSCLGPNSRKISLL